MQFNNTTDRNGLIQDCERAASLGDAGITGNTVLFAWFTNSINQWYLKAIAWILEAQHNWSWDDTNYTDFPISTTTLTAGRKDYKLPAATVGGNFSTNLTLKAVAVKNAAGDYVYLTDIDQTEVTGDLDELFQNDGMPEYYRKIGDSIKLYPGPAAASVTTSAGLKIENQRTPDLFTTADTTQQPGIPATWHRILSLGAAYDHVVIDYPERAVSIRAEIEVMKREMMDFYAKRDKNTHTGVKTRQTSFE